MSKIQKKVKGTLLPRDPKKIQKLITTLLPKIPSTVAFKSFLRDRRVHPVPFEHVRDGIDEFWSITVIIFICRDGLVGVGVECSGDHIIDSDGNDLSADIADRCVARRVTVYGNADCAQEADGNWEGAIIVASYDLADLIASVISAECWMYRSYDEIIEKPVVTDVGGWGIVITQ